jgi:hypothetical protein
MYYEYYQISHGDITKRFFDLGASQAYARQLGKDNIPYDWDKKAYFKDPRPPAFRGGSYVNTYIICKLNGVYGHPRMTP